jgi:hypothetical protein
MGPVYPPPRGVYIRRRCRGRHRQRRGQGQHQEPRDHPHSCRFHRPYLHCLSSIGGCRQQKAGCLYDAGPHHLARRALSVVHLAADSGQLRVSIARTPRAVNGQFRWGRCQRGVRTPTGERRSGAMRGSHLGMRTPRMGGRCQRGVRTPTGERWSGAMRGSHLGMRTPRVGGRCQRGVRTPTGERRSGAMRGSHLGMRTPRVGGRCQRGVRTPSCERRPGDDARFASGDANSADGGALSTRSSHAHGRTAARGDARFASGDANSADGGALSTRSSHALVRTAARRRCAVRIWGCELRGWGGVVNAEFARPRANGGQETMRGSHLGMRTPRMGGRCQRGVRTPSCERRPGDDARFASGDANSADGGALSTWSSHAHVRTAARGDARFASGDANSADGGALSMRSSHALVRTAARRRCAVRIWGCELRGWGGVVNAEFARPRANGGQETMRGSHLGMRTPRVGGRCQRGVRTPSCERRPGDDARFASGDANSAGGGALSTRSSHAHGRTAARRRCAVRIWGCELRGWGGVVNAEFARPRANGGQGRCAVRIWGCELRGWGGVVNAEFARPRANGGQGRCAVRIWGCELRGWGGVVNVEFARPRANGGQGRCAVRIWGCELRGWGGVVNAEFARPRANGGQETMRGSHLGMRTPRVGGADVGRCQHADRYSTCADRLRWHAKRPSRNDWAVWRCSGPITFHASRFTPHVSRLTFHASRFTPHVSRLTFHASRFTPHVSRLTPHVSRFTPHASRFTPHVSRFTFHASRLTFHASRFTPHVSRLTFHASRLTFHGLRFTPHVSRFTATNTPVPWPAASARRGTWGGRCGSALGRVAGGSCRADRPRRAR